jgi:hypothetical protein
MSAAVAFPPFDIETFLSRVDRANDRQEVLQLLRELEGHCASLGPEACQSFSDKAASRLSNRFMQVR